MSVKNLIIKPIASKQARTFIKKMHYSGKVVANSQLHFGVFWEDKLEGVMQFGPCMRKDFMLNLVKGTGWNQFMELNRMAFSDKLPRNSESRAIAISMRLIRKHYPHVKWIVSFSDGTQCGDGTIYKASGFVLTGIKKNVGLRVDPKTGETMQSMQAYHLGIQNFKDWKALVGYQMRYIYFLDKSYRARLTVPELPFSMISQMGAKMYKGVRG